MWRGPVSISFFSPSNSIYKPPLCFDRVGGLYLGFACSFSNNGCVIANSIYKPPLCSDRVGGLYFTLFTNTNLPCGGVGAYVYNQVINTWKCALGNKMCGLGIKLCAVGPILASLYSTSLDTMIYIYITYGIFWHNLSNSGTSGYS